MFSKIILLLSVGARYRRSSVGLVSVVLFVLNSSGRSMDIGDGMTVPRSSPRAPRSRPPERARRRHRRRQRAAYFYSGCSARGLAVRRLSSTVARLTPTREVDSARNHRPRPWEWRPARKSKSRPTRATASPRRRLHDSPCREPSFPLPDFIANRRRFTASQRILTSIPPRDEADRDSERFRYEFGLTRTIPAVRHSVVFFTIRRRALYYSRSSVTV